MLLLNNFNLNNIDNFEDSLNILFPNILNNYELNVNNIIYDFAEIEFYFNNKLHIDKSVLKRNTNNGDLFFHRYGIDISFKSDANQYGGILIRSLFKNNQPINGPVNCKLEILNNILNENDSNYLNIIIKEKQHVNNTVLYKCQREVSEFKAGKYKEHLYRYISNYDLFNENYKLNKFNKKKIEFIKLNSY